MSGAEYSAGKNGKWPRAKTKARRKTDVLIKTAERVLCRAKGKVAAKRAPIRLNP